MSIFELTVHGMSVFGNRPPVGQLTIDDATDDHYAQLIGDAINAQDQAREIAAGKGWVDGCRVCGDSGHHAGMCHHNPLLLAVLGGEALLGPFWKCYHCGALFTDEESAARYFGKTPDVDPVCLAGQRKTVIDLLRRLGENGPDIHADSRRTLTAYQRKWLRDLAVEIEATEPAPTDAKLDDHQPLIILPL